MSATNLRKKKSKPSLKSTEFINPDNETTVSDEENDFARKHNTLSNSVDEVDWDALNNNPNLELWAIRVPEGLKRKYLDNLTISVPSTSKSGQLHTLTKKGQSYHIHEVVDDPFNTNRDARDDLGAGEMKSLSCLVPKKSKQGKLYLAPLPISRTVVITQAAAVPSPIPEPGGTEDIPSIGHSERPVQPRHLLKHRFFPTGSMVSSTPEALSGAGETMEVDPTPAPPATVSNEQTSPKKEKSKRKLKGEDGKVKKSKKAKVAAD